MCLSLSSETEMEEQSMRSVTATEGQTVKVRRRVIVPCLSCPLCNSFYREATTVSECLHTFCKECIYNKIGEARPANCPICNANLGCNPLEKLRPDNSLQDLRDKIFPNEGISAKAPESVPVPVPVPELVPVLEPVPVPEPEPEPVPVPEPTLTLPSDSKKNESLSSLSTSPTKLSSRSCIVERRAQAAAKKFLDEQESALAAFQLEKKSAGKKHGRMNNESEISKRSKNSSRKKSSSRKKHTPKQHTPSTSRPRPQKVAEDNKTVQQEHSQIETENVTTEIENQKTSLEPDLNKQKVPNDETFKGNAAPWKGKDPMWEPLNFLMEAAENAQSLESNIMQENAKSLESNNMQETAKSIDSNNMQENANSAVPVESCNNDYNPTRIMSATNQNEATPVQLDPIKPKGLKIRLQRRIKFTQDLNVPAEEPAPVNVPAEEPVPVNVPAEQPVLVNVPAEQPVPVVPVPAVSSSISNERITPIWFSLVASEEKDARLRLPQMPSRFLRVKDVNVPVTFIKKYVAKKLDLASETEVELSLRGKPLSSSLQLKHVAEMWLETVPKSEMIHSHVGDSAKEFVMVLSYSRKV